MSNSSNTLHWKFGSCVIERKVKYDQTIVDYCCRWVNAASGRAVLFHQIEVPFQMTLDERANVLQIPEGAYTLGFYWEDRPYNIYFWRDRAGQYIGAYFNIVKNTKINSNMITFEDLIIDVIILPDGSYYVLDEDELPEELFTFEQGTVAATLDGLVATLSQIMSQIHSEAILHYPHQKFIDLLK